MEKFQTSRNSIGSFERVFFSAYLPVFDAYEMFGKLFPMGFSIVTWEVIIEHLDSMCRLFAYLEISYHKADKKLQITPIVYC